VSKNHVTKRPHIGSRKAEHDVTEHSEEDDVIVTYGVEGMCVDPGEMGAILEAWGAGGPGQPGGEKTGSWHRTVEEDRHYKIPQKLGDGLATTPSHIYAQSTYHCALCINYRTNNHNRNSFHCIICFRRINHLAVKKHLHSSSGVREVVLSTVMLHVTNVHLETLVDEKYLDGSYRCKNVTGMNCRIH
jgi:hypothetical protein